MNPNTLYTLNESAILDPKLIKNMEEAVHKVHEHMSGTGNILVVPDPDADGYTSASIIINYLKECYPSDAHRLILFPGEDKVHGIPIDKLGDYEDVVLIIAPDCSSNEHDVHKKIVEEHKIDIVILDHHDADDYSPYATMVNISLDDYPNKNLAGAGVCWKFAQLYDTLYGFDFAMKYQDLASVGTISDMVAINTPETIIMVQNGMSNVHNTFLKKLYQAKSFNLGGTVTPDGISFYIAPLINATVRVGTPEEQMDLLKGMTTQRTFTVKSSKRGAKDGDTENYHEQIIRKMNNIKSRQDRMRDKIVANLESQIQDNNLLDNQLLILEADKDMPKTFTGLVANVFMGTYKKPTLVGRYSEELKMFAGSARADDKSAIGNLKTFSQESGLFDFSEGHESAHGFGFQPDKKEEIIKYFNDKLAGEVFEPIFSIDFDQKWNVSTLKPVFDEIVRYSRFWGRGMEEPKFKLTGVPVNKDTLEIKGDFDNYRVSFSIGDIGFIKFKGISMETAKALKTNQMATINLIGTVKLNDYNGERKLQIFMDDLEIGATQKYRF